MKGTLQNIAIERVYPHPDNPRMDLGDLTELTESIRANGILQNLTVVPGLGGSFVLVIGHRRLAAAREAGLTEVPCVVADLTPAEQIKTMLAENMQRSDLTIYEQAQGFQLMLDLGGTVESVAKDTGFSENTVRRRLKLTELDQEKLRAVATDAERRIKLKDFDKLNKIEDIKARNKVLADIGTNNFAHSVSRAIQEQETKRRKPLAMKWLKAVGAVKINNQDAYGNKYQGVGAYTYLFCEWDETALPDVSRFKDGIFYCLNYGGDGIQLFTKAKKPPKEEKSAEELERERRLREAWEAADAVAKTAYHLRKAFVDGVTVGAKNKKAVLTGAVYAALLNAVDYNSPDRDGINALLKMSNKAYGPERMAKARDALDLRDFSAVAKLVYAFFGDGPNESCASGVKKTGLPEYKRNTKLEMLYDWLISLGYRMSDEEAALLDGTHGIYHAKKRSDEK